MYDFIILTTAITRPALHRQIFPRIVQFLDGVRIKWLINVDDIDNEESVQATVDNFRALFSQADNIDAEFLYADKQSCFFAAARRLAIRAHALLPTCRTGVLWLEDDWEISQQTSLVQWLNRWRVNNTKGKFNQVILPCPGRLQQKQALLDSKGFTEQAWWYVFLLPKVKVSFNPSIWSKALFEAGLYRPLILVEEGHVKDPEDLCCNPLNEKSAYQALSIFVDPLFQDVGHRWISSLNLKKWLKDPAYLVTQAAATYSKKTTLSASVQASLTGFFLLPNVLSRSPLSLMVQTSYHNNKLKARLPGVPWFAFELIVADDLSTEIYIERMHAWAERSRFMRTEATIRWQLEPVSGLPETVEVAFPKRNWYCTGTYSKTPPLCAIWVVPIQSLIGLGAYLFAFYKHMQGLKK